MIKKVCAAACNSMKLVMTIAFEQFMTRLTPENQTNSATHWEGLRSSDLGVWSRLRRSRRRGGSNS